MFGYVTAPLQVLKEDELRRYRAAYCGLCRTLGQRHGAAARLSLSYDLTFLTLLLQSLYEPEETAGEARCLPHPLEARPWQRSAVTDYAADMTVLLTHFKCLDDWQDDRSPKAGAYDLLLKRGCQRVRKLWPRQCLSVETELKEYNRLEREKASGGALCACFGRLMSELFVWRQDEWSGALRQLGHDLGEFICLMDAAMDYDEDRRRGSYNALATMELTPPEALETLRMLCGRVTHVFERLPLVQDLNLLRSILYAGVWQQYNAMLEKQYHIPPQPAGADTPKAAD